MRQTQTTRTIDLVAKLRDESLHINGYDFSSINDGETDSQKDNCTTIDDKSSKHVNLHHTC